MPTEVIYPPNQPGSPAGPGGGTGPHHQPTTRPVTIPANQPNQVPQTQPEPQPKKLPLKVATAVALATKNRTVRCPLPKDYKVDKPSFPINDPAAPMERICYRRQKPCADGDPIITYTKRRRFLCTVAQPRSFRSTGALTPEKQLDKNIRACIKKSDLKISLSGKCEIEIVGPRPPKGFAESFRDTLLSNDGQGDCIYDVYLIQKRRKCTCPDGSKCRPTRVRLSDDEIREQVEDERPKQEDFATFEEFQQALRDFFDKFGDKANL